MKKNQTPFYLAAGVAISLTSFHVLGSSESSHFEKLEKEVETLQEKLSKTVVQPEIPEAYQKLWKSIDEANTFLRDNHLESRYFFMYSMIKAAAKKEANPAKEFKTELSNFDKRLSGKALPRKIMNQWKNYADAIRGNIEQVSELRPTYISVPAENMAAISELIREARRENERLASLKANPVPVIAPKKVVEKASRPISPAPQPVPSNFAIENYSLFGKSLGVLLALALLGTGLRRKRKTKKDSMVPQKSYQDDIHEAHFEAMPVEQIEATSELNIKLEDKFSSIIEKNEHLFKMASLPVIESQKSPYNTSMSVFSEKTVDDSIFYFLKGILAIANNCDQKPYQLNWSCSNEGNRSKFRFVLHNGKISQKSLVNHTMTDEELSGPAYFERTESLLSDYKPIIAIQTNSKETTISLSLKRESTLDH